MVAIRCGLCGKTALGEDLISLRGMKGQVCRPGLGCDRDHPALAAIRSWLAGPDTRLSDTQLEDIFVDNPRPRT